MIVAEGLSVPGRLHPCSLSIEAGERVAVVGPNGSGKTSLLRALAAVEETSGTILVNGEDLAGAPVGKRRRMLSLLPASRDLQWPIAVRDVIALGLQHAEQGRIGELLETFELTDLADRPSNRLSTGERARVLMARALASAPALLLLDEPLSNLDPYWVLRFLEIIDGQSERGAALVVSLHDLAQLGRFDRAILMLDGRMIMDSTPRDLLDSPAFEEVFRVARQGGDFQIIPKADRQSSR